MQDVDGLVARIDQAHRANEAISAKSLKTFGDEWEEHNARLDQFRGREMVGLRTGLSELDRRTLGLRGVFVMGAKPGAGKTTFACVEVALGVCRHFAENDCIVVILSLDMNRFDLYRRIHCNLGEIEWATLMFGSPEVHHAQNSMHSREDKKRLKRAKRRFQAEEIDTRLTVLDREFLGDQLTAQGLSAILNNLKTRVGAERALLIVDYLQLLPIPEDVASRGDLAADKYRVRLVQQAIEGSRTAEDPIGDTALLISEARKPPTSKEAWGDSMSELMGSARLGYAGDGVLLYREMTANEMNGYYGVRDASGYEKQRDALKRNGVVPVMLILEKGRDGMSRGKWGAEFDFRRSRFQELKLGSKSLPSLDGPSTATGNGRGKTKGLASNSSELLSLPSAGRGKTPKKKAQAKSTDATAASGTSGNSTSSSTAKKTNRRMR